MLPSSGRPHKTDVLDMATERFIPKSPGRPKGLPNKATKLGRQFALEIVNNQEYRNNLLAEAINRSLDPRVEEMLWKYAYGVPKQTMEIQTSKASDLSSLTDQQLAAEAERVRQQILDRAEEERAADEARALAQSSLVLQALDESSETSH